MRKDGRYINLDLTYLDAKLVLALLEGCDDSEAPVKRQALALAKRVRRKLA